VKKLLVVLMALALMAGLSSISYAQTIVNSDHDFSTKGWNTTGELCIVCHTPHNADTSVAASPLWNHDVTTKTFEVYTSFTLNATVNQPDGVSKLCLSCHDGTVALDSFGGGTGTSFISGGEKLETDLSDDHPISFTYDASLATADGEIFDPTAAFSGLPGGGTITVDMLFNDKLECASCHDVHNTVSAGNEKLLVISNVGSALCLTCHDK